MLNKKNSTWSVLLAMVVSVALLGLVGCDSKTTSGDSGGTTGGTTTVSLSASQTSLAITDVSVVEATVMSGGSASANQSVTFTVSPSSAGYFTPAVDTTDANGVAASVFTAISVGSASISCAVSGGPTSSPTAVTVADNSQSGGDGTITISSSESSLFAGGADTSVITIVVRDGSSQPAQDSTLVKLVAGEQFIDLDGNGYWSAGADSLVYDANNNGQWDALGGIAAEAYTTGGTGIATVNYISGNEPTPVFVKASVDDNGIVGSVETSIQVTPFAQIASIGMASDSMSLVIKGTGGIETATLYATGYDYLGNTVPQGLPITFAIIDNPSNPLYPGQDSAHLANVLPHESFIAYTNSQGIAECPISSGHYSGTVRIRATDGTALSDATQILIASGPPAQIFVGIGDEDDCNVPYWNTVNERVKVVAVVQDYMRNPVNDSTVVYFTTDESTVKSHEERIQGGDGVATTEWISGETSAPADGIVWIIAETAGGTVKDSSWIFSTGLTTTVTPNTISDTILVTADGESKFYLNFLGFDVNGNPVDDGTTYKTYSSIVDVADGSFEGYCGSGVAEMEVTSKVLTADLSMTGGVDDGIGAIDNVYLNSFGGSAFIPVRLLTGVASKNSSAITADPTSLGLGDYANIDVLIADRWGNPLGDHTLNMTAVTGTVTGATQNTNTYGEAGGFRWTAPSDSASIGEHVITVTDTDPRGNSLVLNVKITVE